MKRPNGIDDILLLSPLQQGMLFHTLYTPESTVYNLQLEFALEGDLDERALEQAWQLLVDRHTALRTSFVWERVEKPFQLVHHDVNLKIARHDWSALNAAEQELRRRAYLEEDRNRLFNLTRPPLMRLSLIILGEQNFRLVWTFHHIILDSWSAAIVLNELWKCYGDLCAHRSPDLPAVRPYAEFIRWLHARDQSDAEVYWRERLKDVGPPTHLAIDFSIENAPAQVRRVESCRLILSRSFADALKGFARTHRVTLNSVVQGAWSILLSRYSGEQDVVFGAVLSGRSPDLPGVESIVGLFVNTLPARVNVDGGAKLIPWLQALQLDQATMRQFDCSSLAQVQAWSGRPGGEPLFHTALAFQNWLGDFPSGQVTPDLQVTRLDTFETDDQPLMLEVAMGENPTLDLVYDPERFNRTDVERVLVHCRTLLEGMVTTPGCRLSDLPIISDTESHQLLHEWNATASFFPDETLLHGLFEAQAVLTPARTAVKAGPTMLSYTELEARANRVAQTLRARGVGRGDRVGLCVERGAEMLVALFGILKAGAAYVPLDPAFPQERLRFMAQDAEITLLVSTTALANAFGLARERQLLLDADAGSIASAPATRLTVNAQSAQPEDPAYVIYTSGSTGKPKGVIVPHRAVVNFLASMACNPGLTADDVLLAVTTLSFDIAVLELQLPLTKGATVVIASSDDSVNGRALRDLIETHRATVMQATPVTWRLLLEAGWRGDKEFKALVGGEALPKDLAEQLTAQGVELWNMYGPTETTVWSTCARITDTTNGITIGRPIANTTVYVLDEQQNPCPIGVPGELCIGGAGITQGYWNRREITAERFIPDSFSTTPGARLYRTGDLALWRDDGLLEHLGRIDDQVKIRGFRIELGEIEAVLCEYPDMRQAAVRLWQVAPNDLRIVACCVPEQAGALAPIRLRKHMRARLPEYMVPQYFILVQAIPLTPNGKVDRSSLPTPSLAEGNSRQHDAPVDSIEATIAEIWTNLIRPARSIGRADKFFEMGGHSLLALRALQQMEQRLGVKHDLRALFNESLAEIATQCRSKRPTQGAGEDVPTSRATSLSVTAVEDRAS